MIAGFYPKQKAFISKETVPGHYEKTKERDYATEEKWHNEMLEAGFKYNEEFNFYYTEEGALMIDGMGNIEDYMAMPKYKDCDSYDVVYGKPTPLGQEFDMDRAIYCKNYEEVVENYKNKSIK